MFDEATQKEMTDLDILKAGLDEIQSACEVLYESEDEKITALAVMVDNALKYGNAILYGQDPRLGEDCWEIPEDESGARIFAYE